MSRSEMMPTTSPPRADDDDRADALGGKLVGDLQQRRVGAARSSPPGPSPQDCGNIHVRSSHPLATRGRAAAPGASRPPVVPTPPAGCLRGLAHRLATNSVSTLVRRRKDAMPQPQHRPRCVNGGGTIEETVKQQPGVEPARCASQAMPAASVSPAAPQRQHDIEHGPAGDRHQDAPVAQRVARAASAACCWRRARPTAPPCSHAAEQKAERRAHQPGDRARRADHQDQRAAVDGEIEQRAGDPASRKKSEEAHACRCAARPALPKASSQAELISRCARSPCTN